MKIANKVVAVTGGANGIGEAMCKRFAAEGASAVAVLDRDADGAVAVADAIGGSAYGVDVSSEAQLVEAIQTIEAAHGPIDLFCSNAGVGFGHGLLEPAGSCTDLAWEVSWGVNVMAHVYAARALLPGMIERGSGYFLNTASAAGLLTHFASGSYSATKHAAVGFAETIAINHRPQGIGVSVLCPQGVATKMLEDSERELPGLLTSFPVLTTEEVAESVVQGLAKESFLILPHPEVGDYLRHKTADYDGWLTAMQGVRGKILAQAKG